MLVPTDFERVHLRFTFSEGLFGLDVLASELTGEADILLAHADLSDSDVVQPPAPVPEPGTLLLVAMGVATLRLRRLRRRVRAGDADNLSTPVSRA